MVKIKVGNHAVAQYRGRVDDPWRDSRSPKDIRELIISAIQSSSSFPVINQYTLTELEMVVALGDNRGNIFGEYGLVLAKRRKESSCKGRGYEVITLYNL